MADLVSTILSVFKADTSDIKAKVKELSGIEKQAAQEKLKALEDNNRGLESYIKVLAKVGGALALLKMGFDGAALSIEETRLKTAAAGTDFEALDKAFDGLIDRVDEYRFAARLHQSALQVTQHETNEAAKAIRGMHRAGIDLADATQKVTDLLTKGESTALREYGIVVDEAKYATDAFGTRMDEQTKRTLIAHDALNQLTLKYGNFDGAQETTGEKLESTQEKVKRSVDDLKKAFGDLVISLAPAIDGLAQITSGLAKIIDAANSLGGNKYFRAFAGLGDLDAATTILQNELTRQQGKDIDSIFRHGVLDKFHERESELALAEADKVLAAIRALTASSLKPPKKTKTGGKAGFHPAGIGSFDSADTFGLSGIATNTSLGAAADSRDLDEYGRDILQSKNLTDDLLKAQQEAANQQRESFLESLFGKPEEFNLYQQLFQGVTDGVSSTYEAIVTGSEPASKALKKAIGEQMLAIGKSEAVLAIKETAWAIGELATGNVPGATAHALSAAEHAAAALAAGVVAHELGAGGSTSASKGSGGAGASASSGAGSGSSAPQQKQAIIVVGEQFAESTPRMRQLKAKQLVDRAYGSAGFEDS